MDSFESSLLNSIFARLEAVVSRRAPAGGQGEECREGEGARRMAERSE